MSHLPAPRRDRSRAALVPPRGGRLSAARGWCDGPRAAAEKQAAATSEEARRAGRRARAPCPRVAMSAQPSGWSASPLTTAAPTQGAPTSGGSASACAPAARRGSKDESGRQGAPRANTYRESPGSPPPGARRELQDDAHPTENPRSRRVARAEPPRGPGPCKSCPPRKLRDVPEAPGGPAGTSSIQVGRGEDSRWSCPPQGGPAQHEPGARRRPHRRSTWTPAAMSQGQHTPPMRPFEWHLVAARDA